MKGEKREKNKLRRFNNELALELTMINNWPAPGRIMRTNPGKRDK